MSGRQEKDQFAIQNTIDLPFPEDFSADDTEKTIEVSLPPAMEIFSGSGDTTRKINTLARMFFEFTEKISEIEKEQKKISERVNSSIEESKKTLHEIKNVKAETGKSIIDLKKMLQDTAAGKGTHTAAKSEAAPGTIGEVQVSERFQLTLTDLLERMTVLEDLPGKVEDQQAKMATSIEDIINDMETLKNHVDEAASRADVALEREEKLRSNLDELELLKNRFDKLDLEVHKEIKKKLDTIASVGMPANEKNLQEIRTAVEKLKAIFNEKTEFTEDQYEYLKVSLSENITQLEEKLKGARDDFKSKLDGLHEKLVDKFSQHVDINSMKLHMDRINQTVVPAVEELKQTAGEKVSSLSKQVEEQERKVKSLTDMVKSFEESLQYSEMAISSLVSQRVEKLMKQISGTEKNLEEVTGVQNKLREDLETLMSSEGASETQKKMMEELTQKVSSMSFQAEGSVGNQLKIIEQRLAETQKKLETELVGRVEPLELQIKDISGDLNYKLEPIRKEVASAKSFIEEELIKVKEAWENVEKTIADSGGAMDIALKAKESLVKLDGEIASAMEKIDHLMDSLRENTLLTDANSDKIDLTIKLVDEARERIKGLQTPLLTAGLAAVDDLLLQPQEIFEDPDTSDLEFDLDDLLMVMIQHKASDLHLKSGAPPTVRLDGELLPVGNELLSEEDCKKLVLSSMGPGLRKQLARKQEVDFAYAIPEARFRVNAFLQKSSISAAFRLLWTDIPTIEDLNLPPVLMKLCDYNHGLILITGPAGSGKSTTLSAMINYINENRKLHVVTVEDPIEFIHSDKKSIITQREVGSDTESFSVALKQALRQDPNVILIGEMRDAETIMTAAVAAETGHLVMSTLHTPNTVQAINRIIDVFSGDVQKQFRLLLANTLRGVVSQRLLMRADNKGRIPAVEVLVSTPTISSLILEEKTNEIYEMIVNGEMDGMQTFTKSLMKLFERGLITKDEALFHADHPTEFRMIVEGYTSGAATTRDDGSLMSWL